MKEVVFIDLGRKRYGEVWEYQKELLEEVKRSKLMGEEGKHYLLFVEHDPVYTLGRSGNEANMLVDNIQTRTEHTEFIKVDRGGDITFHGPGQLVVYPIFNLEDFGWGIKEYVDLLEEIVIRTIGGYKIVGERLEGATGVWIDTVHKARKICAVGVKCSRYVTMHGFALNVNTNLNYFDYIHPCGFIDKGVTSMEKEIGKPVEMEQVKQVVLQNFQTLFGLTIQPLQSK